MNCDGCGADAILRKVPEKSGFYCFECLITDAVPTLPFPFDVSAQVYDDESGILTPARRETSLSPSEQKRLNEVCRMAQGWVKVINVEQRDKIRERFKQLVDKVKHLEKRCEKLQDINDLEKRRVGALAPRSGD